MLSEVLKTIGNSAFITKQINYHKKIMEEIDIKLGKTQKLSIDHLVDFGCYLDGKNLGEILLPIRYMPENATIGDLVEVFLYTDSEDRIIATTEKPLIEVGDFAALEVVAVNNYGAFCNWGLTKDLFVPFIEQQQKMEVGRIYVVFAYIDTESQRIAGSTRLNQFMPIAPPNYKYGEEVNIIITNKTPLGYKAIINKQHWGLLYENQIFEKIKIGDQRKAYIAKNREDDKIDLSLTKLGFKSIDEVSDKILKALQQEEFIGLNDDSSADEIRETFGISKKAFKKAIGVLYKQQLIDIEEHGIRLL
jgi:predicted RNA-binding protein (virulence factor B family)